MIQKIKKIIGREKKLKRHILIVDKVYPEWHTKSGQPTHFGSKIVGRSETKKIHEICTDYNSWIESVEEINAGKAKMTVCYRVIKDSEMYDTKISSFTDVTIQKGRFMPAIEDGLIIGNKIIPISLVAHNNGLDEKDFVEWYKHCAGELVGVIHFVNFEY